MGVPVGSWFSYCGLGGSLIAGWAVKSSVQRLSGDA
jgi:hypothetical protein